MRFQYFIWTTLFLGALSSVQDDSVFSLSVPVNDEWVFKGAASVQEQQVVLAHDFDSSGAVWNKNPIDYRDWEVMLKFSVEGQNSHGGDGFAVFLTEESGELGPVYGGPDFFKGLSVVFDTRDNDGNRNNPAISVHYFDGTETYSHDDDGISHQIAGCIADFRNRPAPIQAKIRYSSLDDTLGVYVDLRGKNVFQKCFSVNMILEEKPLYLGLTASNSDFSDAYNIHEMKVSGGRKMRSFHKPIDPAQAKRYVHEEFMREDDTSSTIDTTSSLSADELVHVKLDALMLNAQEQLNPKLFGEALDEVEKNLIREINQFMRQTKLVNEQRHVKSNQAIGALQVEIEVASSQREQLHDELKKLRNDDIVRQNVILSDIQRQLSEQAAQISALSTQFEAMNIEQTLSSVLVQARMNNPQASGSSGSWTFSILFLFIQVMFALVIVVLRRDSRKNKLL